MDANINGRALTFLDIDLKAQSKLQLTKGDFIRVNSTHDQAF